MKNSEEIKDLAYERLSEAKILCDAGKGVDNLFDFNNKQQISHGVSEVRKALKTHDITVLFMLSGLKPKFDRAKSEKTILLKTNALLFEVSGKCSWNEQLRYQLNSQDSDKVVDLIDLLKDETDGLLKWIEDE